MAKFGYKQTKDHKQKVQKSLEKTSVKSRTKTKREIFLADSVISLWKRVKYTQKKPITIKANKIETMIVLAENKFLPIKVKNLSNLINMSNSIDGYIDLKLYPPDNKYVKSENISTFSIFKLNSST